jgi:hypothetical protein
VCRLSTPLSTVDAAVTARVKSYGGFSDDLVIGTISSSVNNVALIGGILGALGFLFLIVIILVIVIIRRRRIKNKSDHTVNVPEEMASMFNIKSTDLEIVKKLGEGSFGAVFLCKYKGKMIALKKLMGSMMSAHVNDFFREAVRRFPTMRAVDSSLTDVSPH